VTPTKREKPGALVWLRLVLRFLFLPAAFFLPAGDWTWWEGWVVVGLWVAYGVPLAVYLARNDPTLLEERMRTNPAQEGQKGWDKVLMILMLFPGVGLFIVPGFDVVRFGWTEPLPIWVEIIGQAVHVPCFAILGWVMVTNTYLARVVKIAEDRDHHVITTGPYAIVRHPMYFAVILLFFATPLALGSRIALIPAALISLLIVVRIVFEDRTLHEELPGYPEYAEKTRYRLIPGIW
jgi:protein-S-isoprenylcysteine O-methyltransferase Ste14